jgi:hypothetical protein
MAQPSLFGPSVAETQLAIEQQDQQNVRQGRTGWAGVADIGITSAQRAARSLGGLFGIEDPRLKEAAQQEAIFKELKDSGVDFTDSEKLYPALINAYQSRGMIDKAIVAAAKYEDVKATSLKTQAEIGLKGAQTEKALAEAAKAKREGTPIGPVSPDKFTPESIQKFNETRDYKDLVPSNPEQYSDPYETTGADGRKIVVQKNLRTGKVESIDKASQVNVSATASAAQEKDINKTKVARLNEFENAAVNADSVINNVNAISSVLGNAFTGVGSGVALKAGQVANALGVTVTGTTESEQLNQLLAKLAQGQARTLPGSLSEKELLFLREAIGTGGMTRQTLQAMLGRMREDAIADKEAYKQAFDYQRSGKNLNDFDFAGARTEARQKARRINQLLERATPEQRRQLGY